MTFKRAMERTMGTPRINSILNNFRKTGRNNKFANVEQPNTTSTKKSTSTEKQFEFNKNGSKQNGILYFFKHFLIFL